MNDIKQLWHEWKQLPFPAAVAGKMIEGRAPEEISATASCCISVYLDANGALDAEHAGMLRKCMSDMQIVNPKCVGDSQVYFGKLYRLCDLVSSQLP
ncbi:MAG: hypothetical protein M3A44_04590 [Gammaproteobacteria bacterium]